MRKYGIFMGDGCEEIEGLAVVDILRRAKVEIITISINGSNQVTGSHNITFTTDKKFEEVDFSTLQGIILPGGIPGTPNLKAHEGVLSTVKEFYDAHKIVAAICAAPTILGFAGLLKGKKATCHPGFEEELTGAECLTDKVVVDDNIITSRGMGTAVDFGLAILGMEQSKEEIELLKSKLVYEG